MVTELAACMGYRDGWCSISIETSCNNLKAKKKGWSIMVAQAERKTHGSANSQWNGTVWTMGIKKKLWEAIYQNFGKSRSTYIILLRRFIWLFPSLLERWIQIPSLLHTLSYCPRRSFRWYEMVDERHLQFTTKLKGRAQYGDKSMKNP